ncbi:MAG: peptidase [Thaumarchaeota archaeon]|nr:peptidase [Nitrososphaerota archaeon]
MKKFFLLFALITLVPIGTAYGHGLGFETIKLNVGDKKISVTTQITPTEFSDAQKQITMTVTDSLTTQNMDAVLLIAMHHDGNQVFKEYFTTTNGVLRINIEPTPNGQIKITGEQESTYGAWYGTDSNPLQISGPLFNSGGLYYFDVEVKGIESENDLQNQVFSTYITMVTNHQYDEKDKNGNDVKFSVKSYYDTVSSFDYDHATNSLSLEIPFDWSEKNISHTEVVHEEVHFPKEFSDFVVPSYTGKANGIELFKSAITIDDYSIENERIVHLVLSQDTLRYLKQAQKSEGVENPQSIKFVLETGGGVVFPIIGMTKNESVQVDLSWEPETIEPDKNTKFIFTFRDGKTGDLLRNTSYDFVLSQNGEDLYRKSANAQIGGDYVDYTFSESQKGPVTIRFDNLRGSGQGTEFSIMVVPEFGPFVIMMLTLSVLSSIVIVNRKRLVFFQ